MSRSRPDPLSLSRDVLRLLTTLNPIMGVLILALLIASLVAEETVFRALGVPQGPDDSLVFMSMRMIMVLGICGVPVVHIMLTRLRAIVETVGVGDPFVTANAERLRTIAWALFALEFMHFLVGVFADTISSAGVPISISWGISLTRWIAVLLLFVLARVFEHGARMREELAATV